MRAPKTGPLTNGMLFPRVMFPMWVAGPGGGGASGWRLAVGRPLGRSLTKKKSSF